MLILAKCMRKLVLLFILFSPPLLAINPFTDKDYSAIYYLFKDYSSEILEEKGTLYLDQRQLDSALICFTIISRRYTESMSVMEKKRCASAYNDCGIIHSYYSTPNYTQAYANFLRAAEIVEELKDYKYLYGIYNNIAGILYFYGDYSKAMEYWELAYKGCYENKDWETMKAIVVNIIRKNFAHTNLHNADTLLAGFIQLQLPPDNYYKYTLQMAHGALNMYKGEFEQAIVDLKKSIDYTDSLYMSQRHAFNSYSCIANTFAMMERYDSAIVYMKRSEKIALENAYPTILKETYRTLGDYLEKAGDTISSLNYKVRYQEIRDSIFNPEEFGRIKDMQSFYELDKIEKQVHQLSVEKKQKNRLLMIAAITLTVILLLLFGLFHQNRKLVAKNQNLFQKNLKIIKSEEVEKGIRKDYEAKLREYERQLREIPVTDKQKIEEGEKTRYRKSELSDEYRTQLARLILNIMDNSKEIFTPDFSLERLASLVSSNTNYVSKVINEQFQKNFNMLLNEYRIREASKRILDVENYGNLTFEGIAIQLGYNSRTSFNRSFKSITGLTPSEYLKIARDSKLE